MSLDQRIQILETINQKFYEVYANDFDDTRQYAWQGWKQIIQYIHQHQLLKDNFNCLDLGCGNGRFLSFLIDQITQNHFVPMHNYLGLDRAEGLLAHAQTRIDHPLILSENLNTDIQFQHWDWAQSTLSSNHHFDLICMFGVLHHIANENRRSELINTWSDHLNQGGLLCVSIWDFASSEKGRKAILPWDETAIRHGILPQDREEGDFFLGWQGKSSYPRFCHFVSEQEELRLRQSLSPKLRHLISLSPTTEMNRYLIFQKA